MGGEDEVRHEKREKCCCIPQKTVTIWLHQAGSTHGCVFGLDHITVPEPGAGGTGRSGSDAD